MNYLTYSYLLTPLHTGASSQAGNVLGIAREASTELPYIPSSSLRGKIRSVLESQSPDTASELFGQRLTDDAQPTEGEVWFADATLLLFPIASYSHQFVWITCPLWLSRWNRWLSNDALTAQIKEWRDQLHSDAPGAKKAITTVKGKKIYLQGAVLNENEIEQIQSDNDVFRLLSAIPDGSEILDLQKKLIILTDNDCATLVETGLQREVRVALKDNEKIVSGGSFRSEEAIPSETVLFFPWGLKPQKNDSKTDSIRESLHSILGNRIQFGGLEGLGRGWTENSTVCVSN